MSAVPFAALMADDGTFLVERHPIVVSPSAAVFSHLSKKEASHDRELLLVVSAQAEGLPPLTEALTEEQALGRFYGRVTLLDGNAATANAFRDAARTASRIHFSGHAIASETTAAETSLLLADRMDVKSIAAIQLDRAPIVILAACSTARGRVTPLEGTMSVARAFLAAGSRSVLATLWPIEDREAAKFFERVHERLARGEVAADALRGAQIDSIRSSVSPSMWAAVQTIGS